MRTWSGAGVSVLVCTRGAAFEMDLWWFGVFQYIDTTILHTFLSASACTACTDMVYSKELEHDVTTTAMAKPILRLKTLAFYSFKENDRFDLFTYEGRIGAVMYMPCVKCSCCELKLAKHLHTFFVLTKNEEIPFWVRFGYGSHLKAKLFGLFSKVNHIYLE